MAEREELVGRIKSLESQVVSLEAKERERSELEKQLSTTKEDLFAEQKRARTHMDTIKEVSDMVLGLLFLEDCIHTHSIHHRDSRS